MAGMFLSTMRHVCVKKHPGQTAWYGWKEYAFPRKGETVFITAAAGTVNFSRNLYWCDTIHLGAVGSFVTQLAKRDGLKVIASAGSDEKVEFARSCGADIVFNYKTAAISEILQNEGPIDMCVGCCL